MELTPEIRQRLRTVMEQKGETGYTLNKKLGISASTISNYIKDDSPVGKADNIKLSAICEILEINIMWLEYGDITVQGEQVVATDYQRKLKDSELLQQLLQGISVSNEQLNFIRKEMSRLQQTTKEFEKRFTLIEEKLNKLID